MNFLLGWPIFRGYVSFKEGINPPAVDLLPLSFWQTLRIVFPTRLEGEQAVLGWHIECIYLLLLNITIIVTAVSPVVGNGFKITGANLSGNLCIWPLKSSNFLRPPQLLESRFSWIWWFGTGLAFELWENFQDLYPNLTTVSRHQATAIAIAIAPGTLLFPWPMMLLGDSMGGGFLMRIDDFDP